MSKFLGKTTVSVLVAFLLAFASAPKAHAAGDAGCGLGSLIIQKNSKLMQLFALTTNGTFSSQPLGITSGTSGCSASGIVNNDKQIEYFVEVNHSDLSVEMAQGRGEKLNVLAQLYGCMTPESQQAFSTMTQEFYPQIVSEAAVPADKIVNNLNNKFIENKNVSSMCHVAVR